MATIKTNMCDAKPRYYYSSALAVRDRLTEIRLQKSIPQKARARSVFYES